jgi:hypothetical protein
MFAVPINHNDAVGFARGTVLERMMTIAFAPRFMAIETTGNGQGTRCLRITRRRFKCHYRFTIDSQRFGTLFTETGVIKVTSNRVEVLQVKSRESVRK